MRLKATGVQRQKLEEDRGKVGWRCAWLLVTFLWSEDS